MSRWPKDFLSNEEICYLVTYHARSEKTPSMLNKAILWWEVSLVELSRVLKTLIREDIVALYQRCHDAVNYLSKTECIQAAEQWDVFDLAGARVYLTAKGTDLYDRGEYGISVVRAGVLKDIDFQREVWEDIFSQSAAPANLPPQKKWTLAERERLLSALRMKLKQHQKQKKT